MFGSMSQDKTLPGAQADAHIFDVGTQDFESRVIAASMETPVIVDFWAPWCGPCKQLMPLLEKAVNAAGGEVLLAKVNLDENQELAQALRVQSVPTVYGFFAGRPIDAFQGMVPESQVQAFVDKLVQAGRGAKPGAVDVAEALKAAGEALAEQDLQTAQGLYAAVLQQDEKNAQAFAGMIRLFIAAGQIEQAQALAVQAPEEVAKDTAFKEALTALELAANQPNPGQLEEIEKQIAQNPDDMEALCALAEAQFGSGQKEQAIETLLSAIEKDREWNDQQARKNLLRFFEALGNADPLTVQGRKKLSALLFS